jgi:hypothetical protein
MKPKHSLLIGAMLMLGVSSCSTSATPRTIRANNTNVIVKPLLAEVEVDVNKKITGTAKAKSLSDAKEMAKWNAMESSGADIVVDPIYKINQVFKKFEVTVTGFHGKYVKVSTVPDSEINKLEMYSGPKEVNTGGSVITRLKKVKNKN